MPQIKRASAGQVSGTPLSIEPSLPLMRDRTVAPQPSSVFKGHDAIAQDLVHRALETVHDVHHVVNGGIQEPPSVFGIEALDQLH